METTVDDKLDMALDDIVEERKQQTQTQQQSPQSQSPNGASGKTRNTKRSERIGQAGPYPQRAARTDEAAAAVAFDTSAASVTRRVYVGNLSWSVQAQHLHEHMRAAGTVVHARVLGTGSRSKGCGLVEFATADDAARAIEILNDTELEGRKIFVREDRETKPKVPAAVPVVPRHAAGAPEIRAHGNANGVVTSTRVYVGNLSWTVKWQALKDHMKAAGTIKHADVLTEPSGRSKGCGLVEYETVEEAARAIEMLHDTDLDGRKIFVREDREPEGGSISSIAHRGSGTNGPAGGAGPKHAASSASADGTALYVGNLPWDVTWQVLKDLFRTVGDVDRVEIAEFPDGRSRGFGIVRFVHAKHARQAIEQFNGAEMNGRAIEVRVDKGRGKVQPVP